MRSTSGGDNWDKMAKNYMKITKLAFFGQNSGGGDKSIFWVVGGIPPVPPPGETLLDFNLAIILRNEKF